ncbi:MAG: adenylate/guanylate cyclase domain-containing protein [Burkholderiaceae bacterium]
MNAKLFKRLSTSLIAVVVATLLAAYATDTISFLAGLENTAGDIRIAALQAPQPQSKEIVIAAITEETVTQFAYRSPVDRKFLADLLPALEKKGAKLIGVDILFDQPTEKTKDDALQKALSTMKVPTFVSYSNDPAIVNEDQLAYMNAFVPEPLRASAHLGSDAFDGTVRWTLPGADKPGLPIGFARKALAMLGMPQPAVQTEINWKPQPDADTQPFPIYPAHALAMLPDAWFANKIVLIGAVLSITDRHRTPMAVVYDDDRGNMPGVVVQAHSIAQYLEGRASPRLGFAWILLTCLAMSLVGWMISLFKKGIVFNGVAAAIIIVLFWLGGMGGFTYGLPLLPLVAPTLSLALTIWMIDVLQGSAERKQRQFVQGAFSRYVSPAVVEHLLESPENLNVSGQRRELTFIFTDIAGFTTLSEKLTSEKLSDTLNAYLDGACAIILRYEGTVDKFIGDAIMSIFNAPVLQADHVSRAVRCALELDAYAEDFRKKYNALGVPIGETRIGVHSGPAVIGNFGSSSRMDFTALGDTVNTAARTEGVNKYFGTRICCTQSVVDQCTDVQFMPIGDVVLKGKLTGVGLYNPVDAKHAASELVRRYLEVYALLKNEDPQAPDAVRQLYADYPEDSLVRFHYERVQAGLNTNRVVMEDK